MGQKTNARIIRLGINKKNWELKYIDKNNEESSLFLYQTLEIQKYLNRFFILCKIKISNCKIFYSHCSLQIFLSFYTTKETIPAIRKIYIKKIRNRKKARTIPKIVDVRRMVIPPLLWWTANLKKHLLAYPKKVPIEMPKKITKKMWIAFLTTTLVTNKKHNLTLNLFKELLLEILTIYLKKKINIFITLQNLNNFKKLSNFQIKDLKIVYKQLKKFARNSFYKEAINILFINLYIKKSSKLIAEFMSDQFRVNQLKSKTNTTSNNRKDNRFLGFLKQALKVLVEVPSANITGIKIVTKGRFNKAPRAKSVIIQFGKFSLQTLKSKIDYSQSTAYTKNGTFGVKVWICNK